MENTENINIRGTINALIVGETVALPRAPLTNYEIPAIPNNTAIIGINSASSAAVTLEEIEETFLSISDLENVVTETPFSEVNATGSENGFINNDGTLNTNLPSTYKAYSYDVTGNKTYRVSARFGGSGVYYLHYYDVNNAYLGYAVTVNSTPAITGYLISVPPTCTLLKVNNAASSMPTVEEQGETQYIYSKDLKAEIDAIKKEVGGNDYGIEFTLQSGYFLIRSRFDDTRDMVIKYAINGSNNNISPSAAYLGLNTATTSSIVSTSAIHNTFDSTPPFLLANYWYLFGEHGYYVPVIVSNGHDKTEADLGSWWQTSDGKRFQLIKITGDSLTFAPRITKDGGGQNKDMSDYAYGYVMTALTHVSGATHTGQIIVTSNGATQLIPFTCNVKKQFICDGIPITTNGVYKCNEVTAIDVHEGYNPITVTQWQPTIVGDPLCRLTFTHRFTGLSVFVSNSIEAKYPMWLNYYGAFQPMGLRNYGTYHPMVFIPKVKEQAAAGKITVDWKYPQDCGTPNQNWAKTTFSNNSTDIMQVDDMPERIIEYHQDPTTKEYLIGFAAGYSLVSSATVNSKRKDLTGVAFQFAQDERNKLYIRCLDAGKVSDQIISAGYVNNFNFYYCYFNPSENTPKVYHYSEGGEQIIYVHSHEAGTFEIKLPYSLEGKTVATIIEATDGATLLTDTVAGGAVSVSFGEGASYIVFAIK